jgi:hypothetical protein
MGDAVKPTAQRVLHPEGPRFAGKHQECRLEGVLGSMLVAKHTTADVENHRSMPLDQHFERDLGTGVPPVEELGQESRVCGPAESPEAIQLPDVPQDAGLSVRHVRSLAACFPIMPGSRHRLTVFPNSRLGFLNSIRGKEIPSSFDARHSTTAMTPSPVIRSTRCKWAA